MWSEIKILALMERAIKTPETLQDEPCSWPMATQKNWFKLQMGFKLHCLFKYNKKQHSAYSVMCAFMDGFIQIQISIKHCLASLVLCI